MGLLGSVLKGVASFVSPVAGNIIANGASKKASKKAVAAQQLAAQEAAALQTGTQSQIDQSYAPYQDVGKLALRDIVRGSRSGAFDPPSSSAIGADSSLIGADTSLLRRDASTIGADPSLIGGDLSLLRRDPSSIGADTSLLRRDASQIGADTSRIGADLSRLSTLEAPNFADFQASPDYQFRMDEAMKGVTTSAASKFGGLNNGATLKALLDRSSNLASGEFGNWWERERTGNLDRQDSERYRYEADYRTNADRYNADYRTSVDRYDAQTRADASLYDAEYRTNADRFEAGRLSDAAVYDAQYRTGQDRYNADYRTSADRYDAQTRADTSLYDAQYRTGTDRYNADYKTSTDRYAADTAAGASSYGRLSDLAKMGYDATGTRSNFAAGTADAISNYRMGVGNVRAAGYQQRGDLNSANYQTLSNAGQAVAGGGSPLSLRTIFNPGY